jgi:hypothetical protein
MGHIKMGPDDLEVNEQSKFNEGKVQFHLENEKNRLEVFMKEVLHDFKLTVKL